MNRQKIISGLTKLILTFVIPILIIGASACNRGNRLKTDEASLSNKIILEEKQKDSLLQEQIKLKGSPDASTGISFKEDKKARQTKPLISLDIIKSRELVRQLKLSEISNKLEYIYLSIPGDTSLVVEESSLVFTPNYIYVNWPLGIACFDHDGNFLKKICVGTTDHYQHDGRTSLRYISKESMMLFYGSKGDINAIGDKLVYLYKDYPNEINQLMMFDPIKDMDVVPGLYTELENKKGNPVGSVLKSFNMDYRGTNHYPLDEKSFGTIPDKPSRKTMESVFVSKSYTDDTTCVFQDYDPIENFSNSVARGVERGDIHYLNGIFHYRPRFNDTTFILEPPNKLIPKFTIDFGERGISSSMEGINPKYNLVDKFVHSDIIESAAHIFVQYTQDYVCPKTARKGTLKFNRAVYIKRSGDLIHIMLDSKPIIQKEALSWPTPARKGIVNDIDYGLDFWPDGITETGIPYMKFSGASLKKEIPKSEIKSKELIDIANRIGPNELLIILIKQ